MEKVQTEQNYGYLLNEKNIKLNRMWFRQMAKAIGVRVIVKNPRKESKHYSTQAELRTNNVYDEPIAVYGLFNENLDARTTKKLGWVTEVAEQAAAISLPYDVPNLQVGSLVIVPSAIDMSQGRVFRVTEMSTIMIYPASITCKIVPEWEDTISPSQTKDFTSTNMNLIKEETEWQN